MPCAFRSVAIRGPNGTVKDWKDRKYETATPDHALSLQTLLFSVGLHRSPHRTTLQRRRRGVGAPVWKCGSLASVKVWKFGPPHQAPWPFNCHCHPFSWERVLQQKSPPPTRLVRWPLVPLRDQPLEGSVLGLGLRCPGGLLRHFDSPRCGWGVWCCGKGA